MPIDIFAEQVLTIAEASKVLARARAGRKPHRSTLYRWMQRGIGGVRLEFALLGGTRVTSKEAVQRFVDRRSDGPRAGSAPTTHNDAQAARIERELDRHGL
jgi:uncharacterized protein DUF1580